MSLIEPVLLLPADESGRTKMTEYIEKKYGIRPTLTVARSILSRPIEGYIVGKGKRYILVTATHHALESITTNIAFMLIDLLLSKENVGSINGVDCKLLLSKFAFIIIPCVNPDGVELRLHGVADTPLKERQMRMSGGDLSTWQANSRGVDLNHNYDFGFVTYKTVEREHGIVPGPTLYSGESPESEPETHGVANLVRTLSPVAVVSLHTQGEEIFFGPNDEKSTRIADRLSSLTGYSLSLPEGTSAFGGLCDYTASLGIPSFTLELGRGRNPLPESDAPRIFSRVGKAVAILPTLL